MLNGRIARFVSSLALAIVLVPGVAANKKPPAAPVNLNTATSEQLQTVPGIGPATAEKILQMRKAYGAFKSVDDLLAIRGIGPKRLEKMRKYLTVGRAAAKPNAGANSPTPGLAAKTGAGAAAAGSAATKGAPPVVKSLPPPKPATTDDDPPCLTR